MSKVVGEVATYYCDTCTASMLWVGLVRDFPKTTGWTVSKIVYAPSGWESNRMPDDLVVKCPSCSRLNPSKPMVESPPEGG